ncbi:MAG TPA: hypothetical protein VLZ75_04640 [Chitinophagales bacterium]|nr:hypothetical protein [Chitinophagales bacterium]
MNNVLKISLITTLLTSFIGVFLKLKEIKTSGDVFLAVSIIAWFVFIIVVVYRFINQKSLSQK